MFWKQQILLHAAYNALSMPASVSLHGFSGMGVSDDCISRSDLIR